ncbi:RNase P and RNase MRP subunit [Rhodosporidiobolus nylandii]
MPPRAPDAARTADVGTSVRSRSKAATGEQQPRKTVYKTALDNGMTVAWPPLPAATRQAILDELLAVLAASTTEDGKSIADWRLDEHAKRRGRTTGGAGKGKTKEDQGDDRGPAAETHLAAAADALSTSSRSTHSLTTRSAQTYTIPASARAHVPPAALSPTPRPPPELLSHLVVGINEVTRALETRVRWGRWELGDRSAVPGTARASSSAAVPPARPGRHRRRKSTSTPSALPPSSATLHPPLDLSSHPLYTFLCERAPRPSPDRSPPYLLSHGGGAVRLLANSEARRLKRPPAAASSSIGPSAPTSAPPTVPLVDVVFACKPDINPPSLVAHLPNMVAAANGVQEALDLVLAADDEPQGSEPKMEVEGEAASSGKRRTMRKVLIVPLDLGAEAKLARALGLRRVAAIGFSSAAPGSSSFAPTHVKHLRTSAPLNPKAANAEKKKRRREWKDAAKEVKRRKAAGEAGGKQAELYAAQD